MKIDRLLGITMYLLNRDIVTSKELCEKFEVSQRTIVRDIESLNMAGIPVSSSTGTGGGYEILDTFKLNKQIANTDDYLFIIAALKGLSSAVDNDKINDTLEKLLAVDNLISAHPNPAYVLDFGIVKEDGRINAMIKLLENSVKNRRVIEFDYTKADGGTNRRTVEPLLLTYKWYAWYLYGYCTYKNNYRLFKLKRIYDLTEIGQTFADKHGDAAALMDSGEDHDSSSFFEYTIKCKHEARVLVLEYLGGDIIEEYENGDCVMKLASMVNDRIGFSLLMGFGDMVEVLEPEHLRERLRNMGQKLSALYKKD